MKKSSTAAERVEALKLYVFSVVLEEDPFEDGRMAYHVYCPALRHHGASTWGYTPEEALKNIQEVLQLVVTSMIRHGESIPPDVQVSDRPLVTVIASDGSH